MLPLSLKLAYVLAIWLTTMNLLAAADPVWKTLIEAVVSIASTLSVIVLAYLAYRTQVLNKKVDAVVVQQTEDAKTLGKLEVATNGMQTKLETAIKASSKQEGVDEERERATAEKHRDESVGAKAVAAANLQPQAITPVVTETIKEKIDDQGHVLDESIEIMDKVEKNTASIDKKTK